MEKKLRGRPPKWDRVALKAEYLTGLQEGKWKGIKDFWRTSCKERGMPEGRLLVLAAEGNWLNDGRLQVGTKAAVEKMEEGARVKAKLVQASIECASLQASILKKVKKAIFQKRAEDEPLNAQDLKRLSETVAKAYETLQLEQGRPTQIVDGTPTVRLSFAYQDAPYTPRRVGELPPLTVDERPIGTSGEVSGGERGEKDTEDRVIPDVADSQDPAIPVPGGGVVYSPVSDTGKDGGVETPDRDVGEPEGEAYPGEDE